VLFAHYFDNPGLLRRIRRLRKNPLAGYAIALAAVAIATLVRLAVAGLVSATVPFATYFLAIIFVALACGFWPGMAAVLLSVVAGWFLFLAPTFSFALHADETWALLLFVLAASINVALTSGLIAALLIEDDRQKFLIQELRHRSQNLFAVIQTIVSRSFVEGQTLSQTKHALDGRLGALARTHAMLADRAWVGAPLKDIVEEELNGFAQQISITGCDLVINTTAAQSFAMIVHELATNATKHGALSSPGGRNQDQRQHRRCRWQRAVSIRLERIGRAAGRSACATRIRERNPVQYGEELRPECRSAVSPGGFDLRADGAAQRDRSALQRDRPARRSAPILKHDPEKCAAVFGKDHAQTRS
jgi:two-component sensor histidine kinase